MAVKWPVDPALLPTSSQVEDTNLTIFANTLPPSCATLLVCGDDDGLSELGTVLGLRVGCQVGPRLGVEEGAYVGNEVGEDIGRLLGEYEGLVVGSTVLGTRIGPMLGRTLRDGTRDGRSLLAPEGGIRARYNLLIFVRRPRLDGMVPTTFVAINVMLVTI